MTIASTLSNCVHDISNAPVADLDLAALVTSRICHDLISPIGAIDNGVELIEAMSNGHITSEMLMIGESARSAAIKLQLFRLAFGHGAAQTRCRGRDLNTIFVRNFTKARLQFTWDDAPVDLLQPIAKLTALALLCTETGLPFGGTISLRNTSNGMQINATSDRTRAEGPLWASLVAQKELPDTTAGQVHFTLFAKQINHLGVNLNLVNHEAGFTLDLQF